MAPLSTARAPGRAARRRPRAGCRGLSASSVRMRSASAKSLRLGARVVAPADERVDLAAVARRRPGARPRGSCCSRPISAPPASSAPLSRALSAARGLVELAQHLVQRRQRQRRVEIVLERGAHALAGVGAGAARRRPRAARDRSGRARASPASAAPRSSRADRGNGRQHGEARRLARRLAPARRGWCGNCRRDFAIFSPSTVTKPLCSQ